MRLLVLLLLLLNLVTFAWIQWGQPAPQPAPAELNPEKIRIAADATQPAKTAPDQPPVSAAKTPDTANTTVADVAPAPVVTAAPPAPEKPAAEAKPAARGVCIEWGPIAINRVEDAQLRLNKLKLGDRLSAEDATTHGGPYWVYYPPLRTKEDADNKVTELQGKGVKDVSVVRDGKWQNAISMGLYSKESIAYTRVENLKKLGIVAHIEARGKAARLFTLRELSTDEHNKIRKIQAEFGGPVLKKTVCKIP